MKKIGIIDLATNLNINQIFNVDDLLSYRGAFDSFSLFVNLSRGHAHIVPALALPFVGSPTL